MTHDKGQIVINSPYTEPSQHLEYKGEGHFDVAQGRRRSGFWIDGKDGKREFYTIDLVNRIRPMVKEWRESGYPGATDITRGLLSHWHERGAREDTPL